MNRAEKTAEKLKTIVAQLESTEGYKDNRPLFFDHIDTLHRVTRNILESSRLCSEQSVEDISKLFSSVSTNKSKLTHPNSVYWPRTGPAFQVLKSSIQELSLQLERTAVPVKFQLVDFAKEHWAKSILAVLVTVIGAFILKVIFE